MHRKTTTLDERLTALARRLQGLSGHLSRRARRHARAIGARFHRLGEAVRIGSAFVVPSLARVPGLLRDLPGSVRGLFNSFRALPTGPRSVLTAFLVFAGFIAATAVLVNNTAAAPTQAASITAADRAAAAGRADRAARDAAPAASSPAAPAVSTDAAAAPAAPAPAAVERIPDWVSPLPGTPLSSCFGWRWGAMHQGIDFAANAGTPIAAVGAGTVLSAGWLYGGYGISVVIDHGNGYLTHYAHLSQLLVSEGQPVSVGQQIGLEGSTGDSTGPHLHFEVHQGLWNQIDPAQWLRGLGVPSGC